MGRFIILLLVMIQVLWADENANTLQDAYIVICNGSRDRAEARELLNRYKQKNLPWYRESRVKMTTHNLRAENHPEPEFPALLLSDSITGLNPGFWIVAALITPDFALAEKMREYLNRRGENSYIRAVRVGQTHDIRLFQFNLSHLDYSAINTNYSQETYRVFEKRLIYLKLSLKQNRETFSGGGCSVSENNEVLIPYRVIPGDGNKLDMSWHFDAVNDKVVYQDSYLYDIWTQKNIMSLCISNSCESSHSFKVGDKSFSEIDLDTVFIAESEFGD